MTYKNITVEELRTALAAGDVQLVDVRTDAELAHGRIGGALDLRLHLLPMRLHELDKDKLTVFYCHVGGRSAQAAAFAAGQGWPNAANLLGGIMAWIQTGGELSA